VKTHNTALTLDSTPRCTPGLEIRSAGSEQLVQSPATGHVHVLNALAARVLKRCDGETPLRRIVDELVAATSVDKARAERDVLSVCADFQAKGLID
jgi:hypothetical protein